MSTKTSFKRVALVAVAALGMGVLTSVSPASATAYTGTSSIAPVRVSFTGSTLDSVNGAAVTITATAASDAVAAATAGTRLLNTIALTTAPSAAAAITIAQANVTDQAGTPASLAVTASGTVTLANSRTLTAASTAAAISTAQAISGITFKADTAGTYVGTITTAQTGGHTLVTPFTFTTTGAPKSLSLSKTSVTVPAIANQTATFDVSLLDSAGAVTQGSSVDTLSSAIASATNIDLNGAATYTSSAADLTDGKSTVTIKSIGTTADSQIITVTPAGTLPGLSVAAVTLTASSSAYGTETGLSTVVTSPTAASVISVATATGSEHAYTVDPSNTSYGFEVSGYTPGKAYKIQVLWTDAAGSNGTATVKDDTANTTAASLTSGTATVLYGLVGTSGKVGITVVSTANNNTADTIKINPLSATADGYTGAEDAIVTNTSAAYAVTLTAPAVTPSLAKTGTAVVITGSIADTYKNPVQGATVSALGTVTTTDASPVNLTGTATSSATGAFTITLPAATALTTSVSIVVSATKTGISSISSTSAYVVNFNATGNPSTLTYTTSTGNEGTATTATTYPAIHVMYEGVTAAAAADITDETYTIATAANSTLDDGLDFCTAITPTTSPAAQVTFAAVAGIKYSTTCTSVAYASLVDTLTVASGTAAYVFATTAGDHNVSFSSGTVTKTAHVWGVANNAGARNISTSGATLALDGGELGYVTLAVKDAFGNLMKSATVNVVVTSTGAAMLDGPSLSKTYTATDANGNIIVGVIAGGKAGTGTITVKATGNQFASLAGTIDPTATTAGTNGLTASTSTATVAVTVSGGAASLVVLINSLIKKLNALATLVAKIQKKLGVK